MVKKVVLDSNIFVAAAFNRGSSSAHLLALVRGGRLRMVWHEETRDETRLQLRKIPPLSWQPFAPLFEEQNRVTEPLDVARFEFVEDPDDRKFAALTEQAGATLVTNDAHLLSVSERIGAPVVTPGAWRRQYGAE